MEENDVFRLIRKELSNVMEAIEDHLNGGGASDWSQYREMVGKLQAYSVAIDIVTGVEVKLYGEEPTEGI